MFLSRATVIQKPWEGQNLSLSSDSWMFGFFFCFAVLVIKSRVLGMQDKRAKPHPQPSWFFFQQLLRAHFWAHDSQFSMGRVQANSHLSCLQTCYTEDSGMEAVAQTLAHSEEGFPAKGHCTFCMVAISLWPFRCCLSAEAHLSLPHASHNCLHGS